MKLDKRFSQGLQALVSYTFSRSEDTAFILHPAIETRAPSIGKAVGHSSQPGGELGVRAAHRTRQTIPLRWQSADAAAPRRLGGQRHHHVPSRRSAQCSGRHFAAEHRFGQLRDPTCSDVEIIGEVTQWFDTSCFANPPLFYFRATTRSARCVGHGSSTPISRSSSALSSRRREVARAAPGNFQSVQPRGFRESERNVWQRAVRTNPPARASPRARSSWGRGSCSEICQCPTSPMSHARPEGRAYGD